MKSGVTVLYYLMLPFIFLTFGCSDVLTPGDVALDPTVSEITAISGIDPVSQGMNQCGPACLEMYTQYLADYKNVGSVIKQDTIATSLANATPRKFWSGPVIPVGNEQPVLDGYVMMNGKDKLCGTYPGYLEEIAAAYYPQSNMTVFNSRYGTEADLRRLIDMTYPVIIDIWAYSVTLHTILKTFLITYKYGWREERYDVYPTCFYHTESFTHFVLVTGYDPITREFILNDPLLGKENRASYSELCAAWTGADAPHAPDYRSGWYMAIYKKLPDLVCTAVNIPGNMEAGVDYTISATVGNIGLEYTGGVIAALYESHDEYGADVWIMDTSVGSQIGPGTSTIASFVWKAEAGNHRFRVKVDPYGRIEELLENNNAILSREFSVNPSGTLLPAPLTTSGPTGGPPTTNPTATPTLPPSTIVVDDGDSGFSLYGPSEYWHRVTSTTHYYGGDMYWTYVNGSMISNYARWTPNIPVAGDYLVEVFVTWDNATTLSAIYTISFQYSSITYTVRQNDYYDQWVPIGIYPFSAGTACYVELTDATNEDMNSLLKIGFDAVRWTRQ